ncbi:hypothetical protein ACOM2C_04015 [Pseudarthrobacter sp. So.54]
MFQRQRRFAAYGSAALLVLAMFTATSETSATAATAARRSQQLCGPGSAIRFDRDSYPSSPRIDNKWFPLTPGMQYTTTGTVTDADGTVAHKVVHTVTGLTKVIDGVKTLVMWDRDYSGGVLAESELAFFAQSDKGDVWLFGEYPEEYENGKLVGAPSTFISGIDRARAGTAMQARPHRNTPAYVQAYAPKVDFLDCGDVLHDNLRVCVPTGYYTDVLVIDEFNPLDPPSAGHQRKYYSAGTGLVKVTASGGDSRESMDLVKIKKLSRLKLAHVNAQALALDNRGYTVSKDVYAKTPRAVVDFPHTGS